MSRTLRIAVAVESPRWGQQDVYEVVFTEDQMSVGRDTSLKCICTKAEDFADW